MFWNNPIFTPEKGVPYPLGMPFWSLFRNKKIR